MLNESTEIAVTEDVGKVYGTSTVTVLNRSNEKYTGTDIHFSVENWGLYLLSSGDKFDFPQEPQYLPRPKLLKKCRR